MLREKRSKSNVSDHAVVGVRGAFLGTREILSVRVCMYVCRGEQKESRAEMIEDRRHKKERRGRRKRERGGQPTEDREQREMTR
jgi:hypothetical protein